LEVIEFSGPIFCGCILAISTFFPLLISCVLVFSCNSECAVTYAQTHCSCSSLNESPGYTSAAPHMQVQSAMQSSQDANRSTHTQVDACSVAGAPSRHAIPRPRYYEQTQTQTQTQTPDHLRPEARPPVKRCRGCFYRDSITPDHLPYVLGLPAACTMGTHALVLAAIASVVPPATADFSAAVRPSSIDRAPRRRGRSISPRHLPLSATYVAWQWQRLLAS
jgi:hypothetical protein